MAESGLLRVIVLVFFFIHASFEFRSAIPMTTVNISLPDEMKAFIETHLAQEGYTSASECLRALIHEFQKRKAIVDPENRTTS